VFHTDTKLLTDGMIVLSLVISSNSIFYMHSKYFNSKLVKDCYIKCQLFETHCNIVISHLPCIFLCSSLFICVNVFISYFLISISSCFPSLLSQGFWLHCFSYISGSFCPMFVIMLPFWRVHLRILSQLLVFCFPLS
jgi:hypothetical protein